MEFDTDSDSELTDEYVPGPAPKTGYRPRNIMKPPLQSTFSADSLYQWINNNYIELDPEYQRDVVWPDSKQSKLIDSLLRNFYVPPIIFRLILDEDGATSTRICIDGKQRLTSIKRFMDGLIPHIDSDDKKRYWFTAAPPGSKKRPVLPDWLKESFKQKQIVCIEYQGIHETWEREIFQRVQLGMPLQPAERLAAFPGPRSLFASELKNRYFQPDCPYPFLDYIKFKTARSGDFSAMAMALMGLESSPNPITLLNSTLEKWLARPEPLSDNFKKEVKATLDRFYKLASTTFAGELLSPLEFTLYPQLIHQQKHVADTVVGEQLRSFRSQLKDKHVDIRLNAKVLKTGWAIIAELVDLTSSRGSKRKKPEDDADYRSTPSSKGSRSGTAARTTKNSTASASPSLPRSTSKTTSSPSKATSQASKRSPRPPATAAAPQIPLQSPNVPGFPTLSTAAGSSARPPGNTGVKSELDAMTQLRQIRENRRIPPSAAEEVNNSFGFSAQEDRSMQPINGTQNSQMEGNHLMVSGNAPAPAMADFFPQSAPATSSPILQQQSHQPPPFGMTMGSQYQPNYVQSQRNAASSGFQTFNPRKT